MSDQNAQDRNLPASQRKLQKAREEGQVARSRDFGHFAAIGTCGAMLVATAPVVSAWLKQAVAQGLHFNAAVVQNPEFMTERLMEMTLSMMYVVVPFGLVMMAAALAASIRLRAMGVSRAAGPRTRLALHRLSRARDSLSDAGGTGRRFRAHRTRQRTR
mgnify:CR=1 FL=1